jgi:hypothetical protein
MTVTVRHGNLGAATTDITSKVRLPGGNAAPWQLVEAAEKGTPAMAGLAVEDPAAAASLVGLKECHVEDSACSEPTIFAGFWDQRDIARAEALRTGAQREWDAQTTDLNALLGDYIIDSGIRPAETDIERIDWLLGSGYLPIGDAGFIDRSSPVALPKADYTGRFPADVLAECSNVSNKNYFVRWEQSAYFPDPASPWATTPTVLPGTATPFPTPSAYWTVAQSLANGSKYAVVVDYVSTGHALADLRWKSGNTGLVDGSPWLDPSGVRTPQIIWSGLLVAGSLSLRLGVLTLDSYVPAQGWNMNSNTSIGYGGHPGFPWDGAGYDHGWYADHVLSGPYHAGDTATTTVSLYPPGPGPCLGYHEYNWSGDTSGLSISNVLSDLSATCFAPKPSDKLTRNPGRVYSGCWFEYSGGHVYQTYSPTLAAFRHRDTRASDMNCKTLAAATVLANAYLARCATEEDRITVNLENVPAAKVNLARPGQRIPVKLTHAPGYTSNVYLAILRRTVSPIAYGLYDLSLDLAEPKLTGFQSAAYLSPSLTANLGQVVSPAPAGGIGGITGQGVTPVWIADGDGGTVLFTLGTGYIPGSVCIWVDAQRVPQTSIAETDPVAGTITLDFAPAAASGSIAAQSVIASWQVS